MGRTSKATIDEIRVLNGKGYSQKEIGAKLKIDRNTVRKYSVNKAAQGNAQELGLIFESYFALLSDLSNSAFLDRSDLAALAEERSLHVARQLFSLNKDLGKKILESQIERLRTIRILDLTFPDEELSAGDLHLRNGWMELLKKEAPEELAQLV